MAVGILLLVVEDSIKKLLVKNQIVLKGITGEDTPECFTLIEYFRAAHYCNDLL
jgi:hypothetical protein